MTDDILTAAAALAAPLPTPWQTAPWQPSTVLPQPWAEDDPNVPTAERGPFLAVSCNLDGNAAGIVDRDASAHLATLVAMVPDLIVELAVAANENARLLAESSFCPACSSAAGEPCTRPEMVTVGGPGWMVHPVRLTRTSDAALRRVQALPAGLTAKVFHRVMGDLQVDLADGMAAIRRAEYRQAGPGPTAMFAGSNPARQSVGLPGHCEDCAQVGHVKAHPELGCTDVGCYSHHDEPSEPVTPADLVREMRGRADKGVPATPTTLAYWADVFEAAEVTA